MSIEITSRHVHATEQVQDYARGKAEVLAAEFPRIEHVHVILDVEKHRQIAEVVVQAKNHIRVEAEETSDNMFASIDSAFEKGERQMRKHRKKVQDKRVRIRRGKPEVMDSETD
jgi:putative sigma-54 modulation protein